MTADNRGSVSQWLEGLKNDDSRAAQELWNRYFAALVRIAHHRLRIVSPSLSGEDVALSAIKSVMIGVKEDKFPQLADRNGLWPVLVTIVARKSVSELRKRLASKRGGTRSVTLGEMMEVMGGEPSPSFAIDLVDELERLVAAFDDPSLRTVAQRKLEGYSHQEIAAELGCSSRTVIRKLNLIRQEWETDSDVTS